MNRPVCNVALESIITGNDDALQQSFMIENIKGYMYFRCHYSLVYSYMLDLNILRNKWCGQQNLQIISSS